ncbi:MAG: DinB family protein [Calditrichaeota bacterium]|nr:DinB family protein [Calditrichota bacterium]
MHPSLELIFNQMEESKLHFTDYLAHHAKSIQRTQSASAWSMNQVLEHLVLVDQQTLIASGKDNPKQRKLGIKSVFYSNLLNLTLSLPVRYRVPDTTNIYPQARTSDNELLAAWNLNRQKWAVFLNEFPVEKFKLSVFKHPYAGLLTIQQTLRFLDYHCSHHLFQLKRISSQLN